ncbi:CIMIP2 protein CG18335 [Linepithema humile]|uniref:CIMIP2 protein CG18335 n=1 Tax=Linepithema humile TaxID=83485 RepID=UPI00351DE473
MTTGMELLTTADPHFIPGYTGYCPQYRFRCGETYGKATHKLLLDPTVNHTDTLILSNRSSDDCKLWRPKKKDIDIVNARFKRTGSIFAHPMLPGYEGFIPRLNAGIGQRYTVLATEGLAIEFERQLRHNAALNRLRKMIDLQSGQAEPRNLEERLLMKSQVNLPLHTIRPECVAMMKKFTIKRKT